LSEGAQESMTLCSDCGIKAIEEVNDSTITVTMIVLYTHMLYAVFTIAHKGKKFIV
jgi:hypothetical protein